jgi:hypothetical protein
MHNAMVQVVDGRAEPASRRRRIAVGAPAAQAAAVEPPAAAGVVAEVVPAAPQPPRRSSGRVMAARRAAAIAADLAAAAAAAVRDGAGPMDVPLLSAAAGEAAVLVVVVQEQKPLPTFEPHSVTPLEGNDLSAVRARLSADCKCAICLGLLVAPHALACSHSFCGSCITTWLKKNNICPCCRTRASKPVYERMLDDVLVAVVEPSLDEADAEERTVQKRKWQTMQVEAAQEARKHGVGANPFDGRAGVGDVRTARERVPYLELHRMLRQSTAQLQAEMRVLQERFAAAARAPAAAAAGAVQLVDTWSVEYALTERLVCHTCFAAVAVGSVRVVCEAAPTPWADLLGPALTQAPLVRHFHHLGCCVPTCDHAVLRGLDALRADDQVRIRLMMTAATEQATAAAAAAAAEAAAEAAAVAAGAVEAVDVAAADEALGLVVMAPA